MLPCLCLDLDLFLWSQRGGKSTTTTIYRINHKTFIPPKPHLKIYKRTCSAPSTDELATYLCYCQWDSSVGLRTYSLLTLDSEFYEYTLFLFFAVHCLTLDTNPFWGRARNRNEMRTQDQPAEFIAKDRRNFVFFWIILDTLWNCIWNLMGCNLTISFH